MSPSDAELIQRSLEDPAAFEAVFDRHYLSVLRYARQRAGTDVGEDIASQAFVVAFDRRATFDVRYPSARPWLLGIATNLLRHHFRDESAHLTTLRRVDVREALEDHADVEDRLDALRLRRSIIDAVVALAPRDREAFLLSVLADLTYEEIASALEIPVGTVRSRIHRARRILREQLGPLMAREDEADG